MKRFVLALVLCFMSVPGRAQVPVPYIFVPNTPASATQVNANFAALVNGALNVSGGILTGNMTVNPGVTIDGIDLSEVFGGAGNKILTVDSAKLVSKTSPQFTIGFDPTHTVTWTVDVNGNSVLDSLAPGSTFTFSDPVIMGTLTATTINTTNFGCSGCINASQIADGTVGTAEITDGSLTGSDIADGGIGAIDIADGSIASIDILNGSVGGIDITDGSIGEADLDNILGIKAGVWGSTVLVPQINIDADGRIIDVNNVAIAFPAAPAVVYTNITSTNTDFLLTSAALNPGNEFARIWLKSSADGSNNTTASDPVIRFVLGTSGSTLNPVDIYPWGLSVTTAYITSLSINSTLSLPNGIAEAPSLRFTSCLTCGMYYNTNNNTTEFGSRFESANRSTMRTFNTGPGRIDFLVNSSFALEIQDSWVRVGPSGVANLTVRGDVMPPAPDPVSSQGLYYIGGGAPYGWNSMWAAYGFQTSSDERWKNRVGTIRNALDAIDELEPYIATWKKDFLPEDDGTPFVTFSAQQVQNLVDRRYGTKIAREPAKGKGEGLSLDYGKFSPILWQATRELHAKSKEQDKKIEALQLVIAALEIRLADHKH